MATAEQVKALIRSHAEGDDAQFFSIALQVAARAARGGQSHFAQELREVIESARQGAAKPPTRPIPVTQPRGDLAGLLSASYPDLRMADLVVEPEVKAKLERVLLERRQADRLKAQGFRALHKLLLIGAPGTGKTLSAGVLAGELRLPLFTIRLDGLITKYMGETAAKLRLIFDALATTRGVYFFDEVDALAGERARANDVGEIRRVLNSFLQFLEQDSLDSVLVAATNHPQILDNAMFRRFDAVVHYPLPTPPITRALIRNRLARMKFGRIDWRQVEEAAHGLSHAEITLAAERAAKDAILIDNTRIGTTALVSALQDRHAKATSL